MVSSEPGLAIPTWDTERRHVNPRCQRPLDKLLLEGPKLLSHSKTPYTES